jgi:regulatory protein
VALGRVSKELVALAKQHRREATSAEDLLWQLVRRKQLHGRTFRRQHPLGRFIADFYCDDARLVVEIDGAYHEDASQEERDRYREAIIRANSLAVLRFSNEDVLQRPEKVITTIAEFVLTHSHGTRKAIPPSETPSPKPSKSPPSPTLWERGAGGERADTSRITAIEPQEKREGRLNIYVDGEFAIGVYEDVAVALGLRIGQAITAERLEEVARAETRSRAREDAYRLLSYRSRSEKEISDRLQRRGYEPDVIAETVERLRASGFLDDDQFALRWVESRGKTRGRAALAFELRQKGVDGETAARALSEAQPVETERDAARLAAVKKVGERPADRSREARARLAAYLMRRGFKWDSVRPVLAELYAVADDADDSKSEEAEMPEEYAPAPLYNDGSPPEPPPARRSRAFGSDVSQS